MLFEQRDWKQDEGKSVTIKELQETLLSGKHISNRQAHEDAHKQAIELENRLLRVRSWGGAYCEVEFSPDIKMILEGSSKNRQDRVLAL